MKAQDLKRSILQLAIQGKLVPQNPSDEPASELLKKIKAEKAELVKQGKIKKDKQESYIYKGSDNNYYEKIGNEVKDITEEIPFEIPENWEWMRFKNLVSYNMGKTPPRKESVYWENPVYNWVSIADLKANDIVIETKEKVNQYAYDKIFKARLSKKGTLVMSFKLTVGKVSILGMEAFHNEAIISIYPFYEYNNIIRDYLFKFLPLLTDFGDTKSAIKGNTLNSDSLDKLLLPILPISEQERIVKKIEELEPFIEEYGKAEVKLTTLNSNFPEQIKKSILQYAIQGKLVEQDPNDEPASVLLEKIKAEKQELIKQGKIKKDKQESYIYKGADNRHYEKIGTETKDITDEIPFEIPESWEWCRLGSIVYNHGQKTPDKTFVYIDIGSIDNSHQQLSDKETILTSKQAPSRARKIIKKGDIIYSTVRPYLHNTCIIDRDFSLEPIASTGFAVLSVFSGIYNKFLFYYLISSSFDAYANDTENSKGVAYPAINDNRLYKALIPIPPLDEQKRIVDKITKLYEIIKNL